MVGNTRRVNYCGLMTAMTVFVAALVQLPADAVADEPDFQIAEQRGAEASADVPAIKRVAVLSSAEKPAENTSQGLYIKILQDAGFDARAINANEVRNHKLEEFDIFIIGGGSGTSFNKSLGADGGKLVQDFIRKGGGALASCAGGYSFVKGHNEALKYIEIAQANCIDFEDGRWARGKGNVEIIPMDARYRPLKMFYQNGPLWEIAQEQGSDRTVALARFNSDVKKSDDNRSIMPGTPAILGGTYGDGRFVLFSGHPEFYKRMGNHGFVSDAARWVTRGRLKSDETIRWEDVFPNAEKLESATDKPSSETSDQDPPD